MVVSSAMDDLRKRFKRTEDLNRQRQEQARSSAPRAIHLQEEQKLGRNDEQSKKDEEWEVFLVRIVMIDSLIKFLQISKSATAISFSLRSIPKLMRTGRCTALIGVERDL